MQKPPVLTHFDENSETEMHRLANDIGLCAVLIKKQSGGENVIAFAKRGLSKEEENYLASAKECLAIMWAVSKFCPSVYGRPFNVVTDHHALSWLTNSKDPSGLIGR